MRSYLTQEIGFKLNGLAPKKAFIIGHHLAHVSLTRFRFAAKADVSQFC